MPKYKKGSLTSVVPISPNKHPDITVEYYGFGIFIMLNNLQGKTLKEFTCVRFSLDVGEPEDYKLTYSLCCYMLIKEFEKAIKLTSVETDSGYTVYAEEISNFQYENRAYGLSENMFIESFESYQGLPIESCTESLDGEDLLAFHLRFSAGLELHVVSGEHYGTDDGYGISGPDEMLLVFKQESDIELYGLLS